MKLVDKLNYLQNAFNLSDKEFAKKFKLSQLREWKEGKMTPSKKDVVLICKELNLDIEDFINDSSSVDKDNLKEGEHPCRLNPKNDRNDVIYEDFAREDNSRYEEKD